MFEECLCLQTRLNKLLFPILVCSFVVSGAQTSTASCQLVPDHAQPLAGARTSIAGLLHRNAPAVAGSKGDCVRRGLRELSRCGKKEALLIGEFL